MSKVAYGTTGNCVIASLAWMAAAFHSAPNAVTVAACLILAVGSSAMSGMCLTALAEGEGTPRGDLSSLGLNGLLVIVTFGACHHILGISPIRDGTLGVIDALYFSTVTFTTLGYGDILPSNLGRPVAAFEAIVGYVYLGMVVGSAAAFLQKR